MTRRLQVKEAKLEQFDHVIFHVGTNDIGNKCTVKQILSDYGNLIGVCRNVKDTINIVISAILPRPVDHLISDPIIRQVNNYLHRKMSKEMNFKFVSTYKPFMRAGEVKVELFAKRDGGLHLNSSGTNRLKQFFLNVITHL